MTYMILSFRPLRVIRRRKEKDKGRSRSGSRKGLHRQEAGGERRQRGVGHEKVVDLDPGGERTG